MTPAESYAQKREEAIELIRAHAPARLQESLIELLRPAIALSATRAEDSQIPIGASKFGGSPDVPLHFLWPTWNEKPLGFLAQINLEEVAPFDLDALLPKRGLLSFFADLDEQSSAFDHVTPDGGWYVSLFEQADLHRTHVPKMQTLCVVRSATMAVSAKFTAPYRINATFSSGEIDNWFEMGDVLRGRTPQHQIFGHPYPIQDNLEYVAAQVTKRGELSDWILLLQLDCDEDGLDFVWNDGGTFYFMIHKEDLANANFQSVWCEAQSS